MKLTVNPFDPQSIQNALNELEQYHNSLEAKHKRFLDELANIGIEEVELRYGSIKYDGNKDYAVKKEETKNGIMIVASGEAVAFLEFGSGVHINSGDSYPLSRPAGIVELGEYGLGHGKRKAWGFYDETGKLVITRGNPMSKGLYHASREIQENIVKIAREVYGE